MRRGRQRDFSVMMRRIKSDSDGSQIPRQVILCPGFYYNSMFVLQIIHTHEHIFLKNHPVQGDEIINEVVQMAGASSKDHQHRRLESVILFFSN